MALGQLNTLLNRPFGNKFSVFRVGVDVGVDVGVEVGIGVGVGVGVGVSFSSAQVLA